MLRCRRQGGQAQARAHTSEQDVAGPWRGLDGEPGLLLGQQARNRRLRGQLGGGAPVRIARVSVCAGLYQHAYGLPAARAGSSL